MPRVILLLIILCHAAPSRAIIPLELVAEFDLPENVSLWDVQHWMDDSTFGWAAVRNDTVFYETRIGEGIHIYTVPDITVDSIFISPYLECESIALLAMAGYPEDPLVVLSIGVTELQNYPDMWHYHIFLIVNVEDTQAVYYHRQQSGYDDNFSGGGSSSWTENITVWPPAPDSARFIVRTNRHVYTWEGMGTDYREVSYYSTVFPIDAPYRAPFSLAGSHHVVSRSGGNLVLNNTTERRNEDDEERTRTILRFFDFGAQSTVNDTVCESSCYGSDVLAMAISQDSSFLIHSNNIYGLPTLQLVDTLFEYGTQFTMAVGPYQPELLWSQRDSMFVVRNVSGSYVDSTNYTNWIYCDFAIKDDDGVGAIACRARGDGFISDHALIYKPRSADLLPRIVLLPDFSGVRIEWNAVAGAHGYTVERFSDGSLTNPSGFPIDIADTCLTIDFLPKPRSEFFRVRAVFD